MSTERAISRVGKVISRKILNADMKIFDILHWSCYHDCEKSADTPTVSSTDEDLTSDINELSTLSLSYQNYVLARYQIRF